MISRNIFSLIGINEFEATPRYIQLANAVIKAIEQGYIPKGYWLPSLNDLSYETGISRDTAEKVYKRLRKLGIVSSIPGKGNFISSTSILPPIKIFMLFNKISSHKKIIYDSFVSAIGDKAVIDLFIYNNDVSLYKKILQDKKKEYSNHIIIPPVGCPDENAATLLKDIPAHKLLLLHDLIPEITDCAAVYENFNQDIFQALQQALHRLAHYHTIKIVYPKNCFLSENILTGFTNFCTNYAFEYSIISDIITILPEQGEVYICLVEDDLVILIQQLLQTELVIGKDVGIISYNETPLKKFILGGITTISADFKKMGEMASQLILEKSNRQVAAPFSLILRESL